MSLNKAVALLLFLLPAVASTGQEAGIKGQVLDEDGKGIGSATVSIDSLTQIADSSGSFAFSFLSAGEHLIQVSASGYFIYARSVTLTGNGVTSVRVQLSRDQTSMQEVVVTGTMKLMKRSDSPVPVDIISARLFRKNPSASLFDAVGLISGVQPQINCNVCNTGDIRINGMEGPYTMILIDGMPIVSALSTVYGLNGIPVSLIEQIEVVKGPGSSLYGSDAMGGIINVITRHPEEAALLSTDIFGSTWGELNVDAALKFRAGRANSLLGLNYFNYSNPIDNNEDGFADLTMQNRISVFNKWQFERKQQRQMSLAARYVYEDRWGGQMNWNRRFRGGDSIYGESVYTNRVELIGNYQLPVRERIFAQFSFNRHQQNSYYGIIPYLADQQIWFGQAYWDKKLSTEHNLLAGVSYRYTRYDDNTSATKIGDKNNPARTILPGVFLQDEWMATNNSRFLLGYRFDYDRNHGSVHSPRLAYKWSPNRKHTLRASFGTGYRVVNLFTEDHAALTGSRTVEILEALKPERSLNGNLNYVSSLPLLGGLVGIDLTAFYTYFSNKITADLDTDPDKIIYDNLRGHALSRGLSFNTTAGFPFPLKIMAGLTYMDVFQREEGLKTRQLFAPRWSGTYSASYTFPAKFSLDITGRFTGPMRLPLQPNDYRPGWSPWYNIINLQVTKVFRTGIEVYGGVKNLFDFVPAHALMRPFDPFDKTAGDINSNPNGYTFDTNYNYAPLQGIRGFLGFRYAFNKS